MTTLPPGWTEAALGDVCEIVSGATPKTSVESYWDGPIRWATPKDLSDLGDRRYLSDTPRTLTEDGLRSCGARILPAGSVLFSSRAPVGLTAINIVPVATNQGFKSLVPSPNVDAAYLYWWLTANRRRMDHLGRGATFKEVSKAIVAEVRFPLPPLEEQRRIAAILDKADELRAKRRAVLEHLDTLTQSIFLDMFGDPALNRHGWPEKPLGELGLVATGGTPSRERPEYFDGCIPWVKTTEVDGGTIRRTSESISEDALRDSNCQVFPEGSVVIAMYGQGATRGRTSILGLPAATNQACAVVVTGDLIEPTYLHTVLQLAYHRLRGLGRGGNQANLNLALVPSFEVPVPPLRKQVEFANARAEVDEMRRTTATSDVEIAALRSSLESRAFSG